MLRVVYDSVRDSLSERIKWEFKSLNSGRLRVCLRHSRKSPTTNCTRWLLDLEAKKQSDHLWSKFKQPSGSFALTCTNMTCDNRSARMILLGFPPIHCGSNHGRANSAADQQGLCLRLLLRCGEPLIHRPVYSSVMFYEWPQVSSPNFSKEVENCV